MKSSLLLLLFISSLSFAESELRGVLFENGNFYTTVNTYVHPSSGKTIHVVGTSHVGTYSYYDRLLKTIENLSSGRSIVLEEFARCQDLNTVVYDLNRCDPDTIKKSFAPHLFPVSLNSILNWDAEVFRTMEESGFLIKKTCVASGEWQIPRPPFIEYRNELRCNEAQSFGLQCQHNVNFRAINYDTVHSDIMLNDDNLGLQFISAMLYLQRPDMDQGKCTRQKVIDALKNIDGIGDLAFGFYDSIKSLMLTYRDDLIIKRIKKNIERYDTLITLWGAAHSLAIGHKLKEEGFVFKKSFKIHFMNRAESNGYPEYQELIDNIDFDPYSTLPNSKQ
jgi:hypothetical protein